MSACSIARSSFSRATDSAGLQVSGVKKWATIALLPIHLQASIFRHAKLARQDDPGVEHPGFCTSVIRSSDTLASGKRKRTGARCSALSPGDIFLSELRSCADQFEGMQSGDDPGNLCVVLKSLRS